MSTAMAVPDKEPEGNRSLDVFRIGKTLAESGYFADAKQASQAVVKVLAGQELNIGPIRAMTDIHVIQGKVALSASLIASLIKRSGRYDYRIVKHDEQSCEIEFLEGGKPSGRSKFSLDDAKRAGLGGREMWQKYPRNMVFARALSNGAKWFCPEVFGGAVYTPEELREGAAVVDDGKTAPAIAAPDAPVATETVPVAAEAATSDAPAAERPAEKPSTPDQRRAIHAVWKGRLKQAEEDLPRWLGAKYGVQSTTDLTFASASEVLLDLQRASRVDIDTVIAAAFDREPAASTQVPLEVAE